MKQYLYVLKNLNSAGDGTPESLGDWETVVRSQERTGSPSTLLPLIADLLSSSHCSSRLLAPLLQTLLATLDQPNSSSSSDLNDFPMMPQSEVLLDMLDLTGGEDSKLENWGPSVMSLVMRLRATALASMILQVATFFTSVRSVIICSMSGRLDLVLWGAI